MSRSLTSFFSLFLSTAILVMGDGLFGILLPLRANFDGFSDLTLGLMGTAYFAGFLLGSLLSPFTVRRVGHIRSFAVFASIASSIPIMHALAPEAVTWVLLRVMGGYCLAGLYMIIESWLNERATNENRGSIFGLYRVVSLVGLTGGQLLLNVADPRSFTLFAVVAILTSLALVPVSLTTTAQPAPIDNIKPDFKELWRISPVGMLGCFVVGLTNGPFWTLGPVYAQHAGLDLQGISFFMTAAIVGGAIAQVPFGRLSDRIDRRWVLIITLVGATFASVFLTIFSGAGHNEYLLFSGSFAFGAFALTLYALCIAQANDHAKSHQFVMVASGMMIVFSVGAMIGPIIVSLLMPMLGSGVLFAAGVAVYVPFIVFILGRIMVRPPATQEEREDFVAVPVTRATTPMVDLDPRSDLTSGHHETGSGETPDGDHRNV
ncbi:MAG: MFS transporter [Parvibaculum sp.]